MLDKLIRVFLPLLLAIAANNLFAETLEHGNARVNVSNRSITLQNNNKTLLRVESLQFNYEPITAWHVEKQADTLLIRAHLPASVDFYRPSTDTRGREVTITISKVEGGFRFFSNPEWGRQVTIVTDYLGDHFFGLSSPLQPDNRLSSDLTGTIIDVDIRSEDAAMRENYASAFSAFYMSSLGYGAFFDTFARGEYQFNVNGKNRIHHDTGKLDWTVFIGDNGADIHRAYFTAIGTPKKLPAWALGPVGWRDQNNGGAAEILKDVERLSAMRMPFTSWFVDRPYSDGAHAWSQMNFSPAFAQPEQWIKRLRTDFNLEFMTWVATSTFGDTRFDKHLAGKFSYLDLSHPPTVAGYQAELKTKQYAVGVKGHKIDRGDEALPLYEQWHDGTPAAERHNKYAWLMAKTHDDILREVWGDNQVTFARTAIHRSQPYLSAIWGGDPRTTWHGLQGNMANAMRAAFMGFPVWGTDVGGYQGEGYIPEDLYIRWMQAGSMTGLFEIKLDGAGGSGRDRMPWQYNDNFQQQFRAICDDRMDLLPYLYSLANTSGENGTLMQPMAYRHLNDKNTYPLWDQYYVGDAILVAPVLTDALQRTVYLPKGQWRDYDNPTKVYKGGKTIRVEAPLSKLPRFIKENSLFVTGKIYQGNDVLWRPKEPLTLHASPGAGNSETQFQYADLNDAGAVKTIAMQHKDRLLTINSPKLADAVKMIVMLDKAPKSVMLNDKIIAANYDVITQQLTLEIEPQREIALSIKR